MLYNIANDKDRAIFTILVLLVALFSTKAQAEHTFKNSDSSIEARIHGTNGSWGDYVCPIQLRELDRTHSNYYSVYFQLKKMKDGDDSSIADLGADVLLDSETPKLKKLSAGIHDKVYEEAKSAVEKTGLMLLDGCAKGWECYEVMGGKECKATVKYSPQDLIKRAEHYLK